MDTCFRLEARVLKLYNHVVSHMPNRKYPPPSCVNTDQFPQHSTLLLCMWGGGVQGVYSLQGFKSISTIFGKNKNRR